MKLIPNTKSPGLLSVLPYLLLVMIGCFGIVACTSKNTGSQDDILKICDETDKNLNTYTMKSMDGYPDPEKRKFIAYYKGKTPRLLVEEFYDDTARVFTHYYLNDDQLVLVYQEHYGYNKPVWLTEDSARKLGDTVWYDDHRTVLQTNTCLFAENKIKKWVGPDRKEVARNADLYKAREEELIGNCLLMLKIFKTQEK